LIYHQRFVNPNQNAFHGGYDVVICKQCGFAFADNLPPQTFIDEYYREMTKKTALLEKQMEKGHLEPEYVIRMHQHSIQNMLPHLRPNDAILDVGCYTGHLLSLLKKNGFVNLKGIDPSKFAAEVAAQRHGIEVVVGSLFDEIQLGTYDFITVTHVIEHIVDLRRFVLKLRDLLSDGGRVYIECPDAHNFFFASSSDRVIQSEHKVPFFQFSVEHVNYFSAISLTNLMTSLGFRKVVVEQQVSTLAVLAAIFERCPFTNDGTIEASLRDYVAKSDEAFSDIYSKIDAIVTSGEPIIVWGAGLHSQKLLAVTKLQNANILSFIDSDPAYQGGSLAGVSIKSPSDLAGMPSHPILISSETYQSEIAAQIRALGLQNKVISLYDEAPVG
jgi:SAM-dependent methyltransferase